MDFAIIPLSPTSSKSSPKMGSSDSSRDGSLCSEDGDKDMRQSIMVGSRLKDDVKLTDFKLLIVLGRGTFGKVYLAELGKEKHLYAIKSIRKDILIDTDQVGSTLLEKEILFSCEHPFLVSMDYLF